MNEATALPPTDGRVRAVIEAVSPSVDAGRFAVKRITGDTVIVEADCLADGHDVLAARLLWRHADAEAWTEVPMHPLGNDRWRAAFVAGPPGRYLYTVTAWVDRFLSWRHDFSRRVEGDDIRAAALVGAALVADAAGRASDSDRAALERWAARLREESDPSVLARLGTDDELAALAQRHPDRRHACTWPVALPLVVDRERARFSSWYELFPRSASPQPGRHGTFADCAARLDYVARMGFDVLYLPPIHPIGRERRKGRNNALTAAGHDVGSPWAIGAEEGGHRAVHPALGTLADFRRLVARARTLGIEIALDVAFQCAPDHPYVTSHPEWFRHRPDGSIQYAENPPKKYQDIFPFDFESEDWAGLWQELAGVIEFWIEQGVTIFRVDNPHTKAFAFWEWAIARVKRSHPEVLFLAEAFTRPKVMHRLAKLGFSQSYTYFAWRNTRAEIIEYFTHLARQPGCDYFRPNLWPNTPDILPEYLQLGPRAAFMARLVLAATLGASYGIYGPAFELCESQARDPGSEEYLDSEKYQLRHWDLERADSLCAFIARVNAIRRENAALQTDAGLRFWPIDNESLIAYTKTSVDGGNVVLVVVNLDPHHAQSGWLELGVETVGVGAQTSYQMHDLLTGARFLWTGARNFVALDPARSPAHVFRLRRKVRSERDFDYFL
ncbi:MAG: alpha-1,4-glucan--maltose-1-phosphate maltosyltransferase [Polyangiaceae bacterium]|nr:alpha-1,4-glucan--maltose-1-phosphate maltosyltransferase [Polyangiaceae bacterium]